MLLFIFWLGGYICWEGWAFTIEYHRNHSVKEFWYGFLSDTLLGLIWPVTMPIGIFEMIFKESRDE